MRGSTQWSGNTFLKFALLSIPRTGGGLGGLGGSNGNTGPNGGDIRWINSSVYQGNSSYTDISQSTETGNNSEVVYLGPTITITNVDPNETTEQSAVGIFGTNLGITTNVQFKKSGTLYTPSLWAYEPDEENFGESPYLYVELGIMPTGVYSIVITNSSGSVEFADLLTITI